MSSPVVIAAVLLYFGVVSAVLSLVMLPRWQARAAQLIAKVWRPAPGGQVAALARRLRPLGRPFAALQAGLDAETLPWHFVFLALLTAGVLGAGPAAALLLHDGLSVELPPAPEAAVHAADPRLVALLAPEPAAAPLPPAWLHQASIPPGPARELDRDWSKLQPAFRRRLIALFEIAHERHGYDLVLLEGYRSPERQARLVALGPSTTLAPPDRSRHQAGLAADLAFMRDGRLQWSERDPWTLRAYRHIGEIATSLGLRWGGHWSSLQDLGHVEWHEPATRPLTAPETAVLASVR